MSDSSTTKELLAGMLNKPLFVVMRTPRDLTRVPELLDAHLKWAILAQQRGELFASGPFVSDQTLPGQLGGMSILRAADHAEALRIVQSDPFIAHGVYDVDVRKWLLMEGGLTLHVSFSNQRFSLL
ncbi:YciI family protein [Pseudomonas sp. GM78]|uniref:YciI family protein n=1 Tax=Pseudomonas sp. GM78 TaxID=1144337 RepID=UPI000517DDCB|nr:YciI family protein [Pseudomonas sp. GM78]